MKSLPAFCFLWSLSISFFIDSAKSTLHSTGVSALLDIRQPAHWCLQAIDPTSVAVRGSAKLCSMTKVASVGSLPARRPCCPSAWYGVHSPCTVRVEGGRAGGRSCCCISGAHRFANRHMSHRCKAWYPCRVPGRVLVMFHAVLLRNQVSKVVTGVWM